MSLFSLLINTTDSFEDCWYPFFKLFRKYWPEYDGRIYLNTEEKDFAFEDINIISIKNGLLGKTWSQCLKYALNFIDEEYILYMQDDYFLHSPVKHSFIEKVFNEVINNNLDCFHLTDQCTSGPFNKNTDIEDIWEIKKGADYRVSLQAAFWEKESLFKLIRKWESGWQLEKFGTERSNFLLNKIMCINQNKYKKAMNEILPYIFTGIIKGKWKKEVVNVFNKNNIEINFNKRGFFERSREKRSLKNYSAFNLYYSRFLSELELLKMRILD